jgi:hypothetical protein
LRHASVLLEQRDLLLRETLLLLEVLTICATRCCC